EKEEDDVKDAARDHPRQDQQERKPDQLHPARNLDLRRRAGSHRGHRTAEVVRLQHRPWDWAAETEGALARDVVPESWFTSVRPVPLKGLAGSATVPRMPASPAYRRHDRRAARARQARRRAILLALVVGLFVILAVAAFRPDGGSKVGGASPASATRLLPPPPPSGVAIASYGRLRVASPVNESVVTAIGYHG